MSCLARSALLSFARPCMPRCPRFKETPRGAAVGWLPWKLTPSSDGRTSSPQTASLSTILPMSRPRMARPCSRCRSSGRCRRTSTTSCEMVAGWERKWQEESARHRPWGQVAASTSPKPLNIYDATTCTPSTLWAAVPVIATAAVWGFFRFRSERLHVPRVSFTNACRFYSLRPKQVRSCRRSNARCFCGGRESRSACRH
jgi:hypothetical protein